MFDRAEPEVLDAFESAVVALSEVGATVVDGSMGGILDELAAIDRIGTFPSIEVGATLRGLGLDNLDGADSKTRVRIEAGAGILATDYARMIKLRQAAIRSFGHAITEDEVFALPTTPVRAPLLESVDESAAFHDANGLVLRNPRIANLVDCPSISLPIPVSGLPVGFMLIGRRHADRRLLEIASWVEAALAAGHS
nr:amidase family protein [Ensifer sp. WSM1721]